MASIQYDQTEALTSHIDLLLAKTESIRMFVFPDSILSKSLSSKDGKSFISFLESYYKAASRKESLPKPSSSHIKFIGEHSDRVTKVVQTCDYICSWCKAARNLLLKITENNAEFDIRWNNFFTIKVCRLFVVFSKVCLFLFSFPSIKIIVQSAPFIKEFSSSALSNHLNEVQGFVATASVNPLELLVRKSENKKGITSITRCLGQLISQIGTPLVEALGQWPLINWQNFSVFQQSNSVLTETTLPDLDHICLANIGLLKETVFFFCLHYPDYISENPQFRALMTTVFCESQNVYLTNQYAISLKELLENYDPTHKLFPKDFRNFVANYMKTKNELTHGKRISRLLYLVRDMVDICLYDPEYIARFTNEIISLCSFAFYEVDCQFSRGKVDETTIELLSVLIDAAKLYMRHERTIKRSFIFNLATADSMFLERLHSKFSLEGVEWQSQFISIVGIILDNIKSLDLTEFDNGYSYDFLGYQITFGRLLHYLLDLKKEHSTAHLRPLLEHMETIRVHSLFADNPSKAFLSYCPIHTMWRHVDFINSMVENSLCGLQHVGGIMTLFSFFNVDYLAFSQSPGELQRIKSIVQKIRASLLKHVYSLLNKQVSKGSRMQAIIQQNRFDRLFDHIPFLHITSDFSLECYERETSNKTMIWQTKEMMLQLPGSFEFAGSDIECAKYIADSIQNCLAAILFNEPIPDTLWVDSSFAAASQLMWPLFSLIGAPFPLKLLQCRHDHSCNGDQHTFLQQVSMMKTDYVKQQMTPQELAKSNGISKLSRIFEDFLNTFLEKDCHHSVYLPHSRRFTALSKNTDNTDTSFFVSYRSFLYLTLNLGPHAGFSLDRILVSNSSKLMMKIFDAYWKIAPDLNVWYTDYLKGGSAWKKCVSHPDLVRSANDMVQLGVTLMARQILRQAISDAVEMVSPGLVDIICSGMHRFGGTLPEKESLMAEVISGKPTFHFLMQCLQKNSIRLTTDSNQLFFFFGLLLSNPAWSDSHFQADNEFITKNLHLIPTGLDAFINCLSAFSESSDTRAIANGMSLYFSVLNQIIQMKRESGKEKPSSIAVFVILADLFPKYVKSIEYGRIATYFPPSVVNLNYIIAKNK